LDEKFSLIPNAAAWQLAVAEIIRCNQITSRFGLVLKESDATELAVTRSEVLEKLGRIEFAGGTVSKLILEFCDSPYLIQSNYAETLHELIETFYYFKNETLDEIDDDELIALMKKSFDESCRGSVDLLQTRDMEILARRVRFGLADRDDLGEDTEGIFEEDPEETEEYESEEYGDYMIEDFEDGTLESLIKMSRNYWKEF
jgi:hypothetical protein